MPLSTQPSTSFTRERETWRLGVCWTEGGGKLGWNGWGVMRGGNGWRKGRQGGWEVHFRLSAHPHTHLPTELGA